MAVIILGVGEGDAGGLYAVPEEADVAGEAGVDPAQLVLRVAQSLVLCTRLLLPETITNPMYDLYGTLNPPPLMIDLP